MSTSVLIELLAASVRIATPLLLVALGGVLSENAGTFAVGLEGMMLMGAFGGAVSTFVLKNVVAGLVASVICGAALAAVVAVATAKFRADQMVTGLAVNILAFGLTSFLLRGLFGGRAPVIALPTLGPVAAFSVGTNPVSVRMAATIAGGGLAGVGGAVLSLQEIGTFTDGMTNGRGFIALAAIIVGRWMPFRVMLGCLLFGAASAVALNIQGWGLPVSSYIIQMTPYLIALAVLCGVGRATRMPAAIGKPFTRS